MGFISRRVLPICGNMCVCCPGLRSRSRQPVKRYKKLLSQIFPKTIDGPVNERKIAKLCEYAAKNPFRIPKIAQYLEQRSYKELRCEHFNFLKIIMEVYNKLLCMCKEQMAYFAANLLNVILELLDNTRQDATRILGCQTLTIFIYSQADSTYTHNIESLVRKVCMLAREAGEEHDKCRLRASSLQCLSAMLWFMAEFSQIVADFDEIVHVTLDNYEVDTHLDDDEERGESHHNWVDEVVRCEGRGGASVGNDVNANYMIIRSRPEIKDPSILTREEIETPKVWAQICIQKIVELAKESTTMRRVLDPMFIYFDTGRHWAPRQGLALVVLSDMSYLMESSGNAQLVLAAIIRHLDHKNVAQDPLIKSDIIQVAAVLARQFRSQAIVAEIGVVSDLCRHLRKSLQATVELFGQQESYCNISLQNSIEDCLLEIAKGIGDARPLFDMMAITLEKLLRVGVVARAIIGSLLILAHIISLASVCSHSQQFFPEALLLQLLKTMMHPDVEARVLAHQIYAVLLVPTSHYPKHEFASFRSEYLYEPRKWESKTASAFASATALLEKLRRENESVKVDKNANDAHDDLKGREVLDEEWRHGRVRKNSPNFYKISCSIIDKKAKSTSSIEAEPNIVRLSEDQTSQLLSAFWIQANLPDNLPSNFEAIGYSFSLTLLSSRLKNTNHNIAVRFFQLPLSLRKVCLDPNGILPPSCQRSLFTLVTAMLMFAAKTYHIPEMNELLKSPISFDVDPYLKIGDDLQVYVPPLFNGKEYGSTADQHAAASSLSDLRKAVSESDKALLDIMVRGLWNVIEPNVNDLAMQLSETFTPDDAFLFDPQSILDLDHIQMIALSKESLSFDEDFPTSSQIEDDVVSELSAADFPRFVTKIPASPSLSHIISVGQLLESALEVAGQVAGTSISTSPLPYSTMAGHCEALGTGTRKKLSSWLGHDSKSDKLLLTFPSKGGSAIGKVNSGGRRPEAVLLSEPWLALRLPPASPYDNFLKAAGC